jgi:hypothetical protein
MPCNGTAIYDHNVDAKSGSRALYELIAVTLFTIIFLTGEVSWRKRSTICKVEDASTGSDVDEADSDAEETRVFGATQAELDWIAAARSGSTRLTEDVYRAAMQWLINLPLADIVDRVSPEDRRLLKPVIELLRRGDEEKAFVVMEQVGSLDRMERLLQRSRAEVPHDDVSGESPLSRSLRSHRDPGKSAACLRQAIEHYVMPPAEDPYPTQKSPFGYMSWKHSPISIGERLVTRPAKLTSPRGLDARTQHPLPQDGCFWMHDTDSGCGA